MGGVTGRRTSGKGWKGCNGRDFSGGAGRGGNTGVDP